MSALLEDYPDPVTLGNGLTYTATVRNNGTIRTATGVSLSVNLARGVIFYRADTGCALSSSTVACTIGNLAPGADESRFIVVSPTQIGGMSASASVTGDQADPNTANNQASAVTAVNGPSPTPTTTPIPQPAADLSGSWLKVKQACRGATAKLRCTHTDTLKVSNMGQRVSPKVRVRVFLSSDAQIDPGDLQIYQFTVAKLKPGKAVNKKFTVRLPKGFNPSAPSLVAWVDADNRVRENNEVNNVVIYGPLP